MTSKQFIVKLKESLKGELPGWDTQSKYLPIKGLPDINYKTNIPLRKGAVLTCLYIEDNQLMTLLIERTQDSSPHSGQIAFPGGKFEEKDENQINTAFREAYEEIGINPNDLELLGSLTPIDIPISGFTVLPVVAWHNGIPELKTNPDEVATLIKTSVSTLLSNFEIKRIPVRQHKVTTPCFIANGYIVWGATAMVLGEFREIIKNINPALLQE